MIGTRTEGHGLGGVGDVLVERGIGGRGGGEAQLETGIEIERRWFDGAAACATRRPGGEAAPSVGAGFEGGDRRDVGLGGAVFEILIEEGAQNFALELKRGVGVEFQRAEGAAVFDFLTVMPRAHDEEDFVVVGVFRLDGFVNGDGAVDVLLIPEAMDEHHGDFQGLGGENLVDGLFAPEGVVGGMVENLAPEADLLEAMAAAQLTRRHRIHVNVVVVEMAGPPLRAIVARGFLFIDVGHVLLAESPVVEPVVAYPAVDHGIHGNGNFERGVRIDERHQREEAVVGNAENADLAVAFGDIFDEPVDGVVRVGGMIDGGGILRAVQRAIHDVVTLGAVLAANVLDHADVAAFDDDFDGVVVAVEDGTQMGARRVTGELVGVVRRAGEEDRSVLCAFRNKDDGVKLDAVAHRDHDLAADVVEGIGDGIEVGGSFAGESGLGGGGFDGQNSDENRCEQKQSRNAVERFHGSLRDAKDQVLVIKTRDYILGLLSRASFARQ